ncbi:MAG: transporter substrate-binding domain-containing protein [Deltaproteobacteria bacterium]|nr:transporter substrate-binding domain-containing protein [Deltaproteobacteria bacterium]
MRTTYFLMSAILGLFLTDCAGSHTTPTPEARQALAPTGKLRVELYRGNPLSLTQDPASGEMRGVGFDLGKELARRMGISFEPVVYPSIGAVVDSAKSDQWDVAFITVVPGRAKDMDLTAPYVEIERGYLVPSGSHISTVADVDRPGIRVAVPADGGSDILLSRVLKNAVVVRGNVGGIEMLKSGRADVFASNKATLFELSNRSPGFRVLDGRFATDPVAMAIPKGRDRGMVFARRFVEDAKSAGFVKAALERAGVRGAVVAPLQ